MKAFERGMRLEWKKYRGKREERYEVTKRDLKVKSRLCR
jgi:hypothetical protein